jgi:RNA polymerase II subunit A small phosphatase-like protein
MYDRILIVADLDETLIHSTSSESERSADFKFGEHYVYVRPYLSTFIQKCTEFFDFAVWSSGGETYVNSILSRIIPPSIELRFVWTRSAFVNGKVFIPGMLGAAKNLNRLIANGFKPSTVLIIDDNPDDSVIEFGNVLQVQPYRGQPEDCELLLLSQYLEKLKFVKDTLSIASTSWRNEVS